MDLRAPFIPFVHVPGISFDLIKEIKKKQQSKELKKLQREPISSSNENVNDKKLKAPIEESFRFFDNANFRYKHFRNSLGYKMNF